MITLDQYTNFFKHYNHSLINFARAYLNDIQQAEDCAMEACVKLWEKRHEIIADNEYDLLAWTLTVVKNNCINILRRQKVIITDSSDEAWALGERIQGLEDFDPEKASFSEMHDIVVETLRRMPHRTREVFLDCINGNFSHDEVAIKYGITRRGVEYHLYKARKLLRDALGDYAPIAFLMATFFR